MNRTHKTVLGMLAIVAIFGTTPAFAEINSTSMEGVSWVTGETVPRTTIDATCGEKNNVKLIFTFFDDYVHVVTTEDGEIELQRYFNYDSYSVISDALIQEVVRC